MHAHDFLGSWSEELKFVVRLEAGPQDQPIGNK